MVIKDSKRYNELSGKEWLQYSFSIWRDIKKTNGERILAHPAMFPIQLVSRIIDIFTKTSDVVLDPFMGIGSTIIAAYLNKRQGIGFELSKDYSKVVYRRIHEAKEELCKNKELIEPEIYNQDSRLLLDYVKPNSVDLCVTSPPYWDILNMRRTADGKKVRKYSDSKIDLGNVENYSEFLEALKNIFTKVYVTLKPNGYCVVILMDIRKKDKFYPFHSDFANRMQDVGFEYEDIIIWDRQHEYNNMKPLGYPYVFRVNKVHEYVLVFRKRRPKNG
ncbi:MAG: DNA methyltransferase [Planctomycetota bacterium]